VDFLFADRTFSALCEVPKYSMGTWAKYGLKFLTGWWDNDLTSDYVFTSCYKVIACDTNDEVICEQASLKTGVSNQIIKNELNYRLMG
jgi:hypothetical protein